MAVRGAYSARGNSPRRVARIPQLARRAQIRTRAPSHAAPNQIAKVDVWTERHDGARADTYASGEDMVLHGVARNPDVRPMVILCGVTRDDVTPIFGTHSDETGFVPTPLGDGRFGLAWHLRAPPLLPGKNLLRAHAVDPGGWCSSIPSRRQTVVVHGETRDYGLLRLDHAWPPGPVDGVAAPPRHKPLPLKPPCASKISGRC